jgi:hypothetical protein
MKSNVKIRWFLERLNFGKPKATFDSFTNLFNKFWSLFLN